MKGPARIGFAVILILVCVGLGVFGGFAGGYWVLPLTILVPILPVRLARYQGLGPLALIAYVIGVLLAVAWLMGNSFFIDPQPSWPTTPIILACTILVILSVMMVYAALRKPYVRNRLP